MGTSLWLGLRKRLVDKRSLSQIKAILATARITSDTLKQPSIWCEKKMINSLHCLDEPCDRR